MWQYSKRVLRLPDLGITAVFLRCSIVERAQSAYEHPYEEVASMAEAVGIRGIELEDPGEVDEGIAAALAHDGPVLVDAVVNRRRRAGLRIDYDIANPGKEAYGSRYSGEP